MKLQTLAQLEGPQAMVGALGPGLDHLRLDGALLVGAKKRVIDHVAVIAAHVGGGPDRVEHCQIGVRHDPQDGLLCENRRCRRQSGTDQKGGCRALDKAAW
jgi:hypothetical protein